MQQQPVQAPPMGLAEVNTLAHWLQNTAPNFLSQTAPGSIVNVPLSNAVRLRWFNVAIQGNTYLVGLNIHYGHPGTPGALWIKNEATQSTYATHPNQAPQHNLTAQTVAQIAIHVQVADHQNNTNYYNSIS